MATFLNRLPKRPLRRYVSNFMDCSKVEAWVEIYRELVNRPLPSIPSVQRWLADVYEASVVLGEYGALAYIRKSVNTRDKKANAEYLHIIQKIQPGLAAFQDQLNQKLLAHPLRRKFPKRWKLMLRSRQNAVDLFCKKNIPLERKGKEIELEYAKLAGGLEVEFEGRKQTLVQMGTYLERSDRSLRQQAWEAMSQKRYEVRHQVDSIYARLVRLRTQMARNAGFKNFRDYCHQRYDRFDYKPKDCFTFHDSVEEVVVPALRELRKRRANEMKLSKLSPWDLAADPLGRPPLKPFSNGKDLARLTQTVFNRLDPALGKEFNILIRHGLLDLDNRPGKEPGGYQCTLDEHQLPFIFMNAVGRDYDVRVLLHEGGHAFHMLATRDEPILDYRQAPMEFCEVASMSMELLGNKKISAIYPRAEDLQRSTRNLLEGIMEVLPWIATIDAFQHWVYLNPDHSRSERYAAWMKLRKRFHDGTDWEAYRKFEEILWHRQGHLFANPFYYIEYGIAQLGALMVWRRFLKNPSQALASYKYGLSLGGSVGLKELFRAAGAQLDFSVRNMKPLVKAVIDALSV